jgi:hypothetical protein
MPSHLHMLCKAKEGYLLSNIIRDFKKYTSKKLIETLINFPESRREWMLDYFKKARWFFFVNYCDLKGINGINFKNYAVTATPIMYILDRKGILLKKIATVNALLEWATSH